MVRGASLQPWVSSDEIWRGGIGSGVQGGGRIPNTVGAVGPGGSLPNWVEYRYIKIKALKAN